MKQYEILMLGKNDEFLNCFDFHEFYSENQGVIDAVCL